MSTPSNSIGIDMLRALGLPTEHVASLTLTFEPGEVVKATVVFLLDRGAIERSIRVIESHHIKLAREA